MKIIYVLNKYILHSIALQTNNTIFIFCLFKTTSTKRNQLFILVKISQVGKYFSENVKEKLKNNLKAFKEFIKLKFLVQQNVNENLKS